MEPQMLEISYTTALCMVGIISFLGGAGVIAWLTALTLFDGVIKLIGAMTNE